jgi:NAD(P)-dependent dehydrogenase (short-subunit alcohol dehydrogenase family)
VVAGASAGVGRAVAARFARDGADVVLLARNRDRLMTAACEIGERAHPLVADVGEPASVGAAFDQIGRRFGHVDVLVNNAAIGRVTRIEDATDDDISSVVHTNFLGPIYTTRRAIPLLRAAGGGHVINVSSEVTLDDMPHMTLYSSTKRAVNGFTTSMTKELRGEGIRFTLVILGSVGGTDFAHDWTADTVEAATPVWAADGYGHRVSRNYRPMTAECVAPEFLHIVTRPPEMMIDVVHLRAAG